MAETVEDVVGRIRRTLQGSRRGQWNRIAGFADTSTTLLTMARPLRGLKPGVYIGVNSEIMYVTDTDGLNVEVERGVDRPVTEHPALSKVEIGWRWFSADLLDIWGDEIRSWPDSLFSVGQVDVGVGIATRSVDLALERFRFPLQLRRLRSAGEWVNVPSRQYRIETGLPTDQFPSGNALIVASNPDTATYRLDYAQRFDTTGLGALDTQLADIGITEHLVDVSIHGVAARALVSDEVNRTERSSQPEPREAEEVEPSDPSRAASVHLALRDARINDEIRRLRQSYRTRF